MTRSEIPVKALLSSNILVTLLKKKKKRKPKRKVKHIVSGHKVKVRFSITHTRSLEVHKTSWNGRVV